MCDRALNAPLWEVYRCCLVQLFSFRMHKNAIERAWGRGAEKLLMKYRFGTLLREDDIKVDLMEAGY